MTDPQRLSFVTLGAHSVSLLRTFYTGWGWHELPGAEEDFVQYDAGGTRLALYSLERLRDEAAPGAPLPSPGEWNGITLAINVDSATAVDEAHRAALAAGGRLVASPVKRDWGGYSGYLADPEGNRWEIAWLPGFSP
ncbi:MAG: VOC family protein [Propionibacteriaceae bacterium]